MLELHNICVEVPAKLLLDNVSCSIKPGKLSAVMGANGAGKSTLLKTIAGEIKPTRGDIRWNGLPLAHYNLKDLARSRSFLRQHYNLQLPFSVAEVVEMGRYPYFRSRPGARCLQVIKETGEYTGIQHLMKRNYLTLSGGEQQRVQLARVLAQVWDAPAGQRLIMLDEPVSALDMHYQHQLLDLMRDLAHNKGYTVLAILHDLNLAFQYADDVLLLRNGRTIAAGPQSEVLSENSIFETFGVAVTMHEPQGYAHRYATVNKRTFTAEAVYNKEKHNNYSF